MKHRLEKLKHGMLGLFYGMIWVGIYLLIEALIK
jgi:hypothetical protein